jgi:flagellar export protein FliJ
MKPSAQTRSLATLAGLREREVERLRADVAAKEAERLRYLANLERMARLCTGGAGGAGSGPQGAALSLNFGHYKQGVLQMADTHRTDLALHEAQTALTRRALATASQKHEALAQVLAERRRRALRAEQQRDQKRQDEIAGQVWAREALR